MPSDGTRQGTIGANGTVQTGWPGGSRGAARAAGDGLPDARLAERRRGRRAGGAGSALARSDAHGGEPGRLVHHDRGAGVPGHAALAQVAARGAAGGPSPTPVGAGGPMPSRKRCWPTRLAWRCWWCSTRWRPPSGWRSCCTTCSACRSGRSRITGRSPDAARQLASRARRRVRGEARRRPAAARGWPAAAGGRGVPRRLARRRPDGAARGARPRRGAARGPAAVPPGSRPSSRAPRRSRAARAAGALGPPCADRRRAGVVWRRAGGWLVLAFSYRERGSPDRHHRRPGPAGAARPGPTRLTGLKLIVTGPGLTYYRRRAGGRACGGVSRDGERLRSD